MKTHTQIQRQVMCATIIVIVLAMATMPLGARARPLATTVVQYGTGDPGWPTDWIPIPSLNDPHDTDSCITGGGGREHLDFVGNSTYPGAYYAESDSYLYFRIRVHYAGDVSTSSPFSDNIWILT